MEPIRLKPLKKDTDIKSVKIFHSQNIQVVEFMDGTIREIEIKLEERMDRNRDEGQMDRPATNK